MKPKRGTGLHGLRNPRIRQSWNKYNLYNLANFNESIHPSKTYYQKKWRAKSMTRGYHGEHIREGTWERAFSRRLRSVVNMRPEYLANHDGSEQAAGRGSGLQGNSITNDPGITGKRLDKYRPTITPYMLMTFAPLERRLDTAIFRAMFASSARQARQFVIHGAVKVNGVKMVHPTYLLNPGDMFQVDVEKVLIATGRPRPRTGGSSKKQDSQEADAAVESTEDIASETTESVESVVKTGSTEGEVNDEATLKQQEMNRLKALHGQAKAVLTGNKNDLSAKRKQEIRALLQNVKREMSLVKRPGTEVEESQNTIDNLVTLMSRLTAGIKESAALQQADNKSDHQVEDYSLDETALTDLRRNQVVQVYEDMRDNPVDTTKPYLTPWRPRAYMAPFAMIPAYLEVNQNICAAVYLRHPVARLGNAEVPTPFSYATNQLAFNWYLRRR